MQIYSFSPFGYEGALVTVEVDLRRGIPAIDLVGLADNAVKEARERMQAAIRNSGFEFPPERILISLSPADLKKEGAGFDLPIALAVLYAKESTEQKEDSTEVDDSPILVMGELELSGKIRPVRGIHAAAATAASGGIFKCIVPSFNAEEAREVEGMKVFGADSLQEAFLALKNQDAFTPRTKKSFSNSKKLPDDVEEVNGVLFPKIQTEYDFCEVKGQKHLIRALQIAAAGGHNLLAVGAPGCGKSMSLQKIPSITPLLLPEEAQSVRRIYSLAGLSSSTKSEYLAAPFRTPHQTASIEGICGGGVQCRPGEISLSHNGILFLDEAAEFRTSVLQMLRVPLESGTITISRAGRSTVFPSKFQLLMAANPCPCGNLGNDEKVCLCNLRSIELYWKKFSAPLLDRIDLRVFVKNEKSEQKSQISQQRSEIQLVSEERLLADTAGLNSSTESISSAELRVEVANAVLAQRKRQGKRNAYLIPSEIAEFCVLDEDSKEFLNKSANRIGFSPRGIASCLKIARTICDMESKEKIEKKHIEEAVEFRKPFNDFNSVIEM